MGETFLVLICVIVVPLWIIFHYITKWKEMKTLSPEGEHNLTDMRRIAEKLEDRINTLERILDSETPGWRSKYHDNQ